MTSVKNSRQGRDLPISENDRVISPIHDDFIFHETSHMLSFTKIKPSQNFPNISSSSQQTCTQHKSSKKGSVLTLAIATGRPDLT